MAQKTFTSLSESDNWTTLVKNITNSLGRNYEYSEGKESDHIDAIFKQAGSDAEILIQLCKNELLETEKVDDFELVWSRIKGVAVILTRIGQGHLGKNPSQDVYNSMVPTLWKAVDRCGTGSWISLGHDKEDGWTNWQKHKYPLDSLFFALAWFEEPDARMERFFNCNMTTYWKSFYIDWDVLWFRTNPVAYLDGAGFKLTHRIFYYELLTFRLAHFNTEFERHPDKIDTAERYLTQDPKPDEHGFQLPGHQYLPGNPTLRRTIYDALTYFYRGQRLGNSKIFNKIFNVLEHDTIQFIIEDEQYDDSETGKVLLSTSETLKNSWDTDSRIRKQLLPILVTTISHNEAQVRKQAKGFLKEKSPDTIQYVIESYISDLDKESGQEQVSDFISNLIEFGSPVAIRAVLQKCIIWIVSDENWILIDRAAQKLRYTPDAVRPLVYQLNTLRDDRRVRKVLRQQVLIELDIYALDLLFKKTRKKPPAPKNQESDTSEKKPTTKKTEKRRTIDTPEARFKRMGKSTQENVLERITKWIKSFKGKSKVFDDRVASWEEHTTQTNHVEVVRETLDATHDILNLLIEEKVEEHNLKVSRWITGLLSYMSDFNNFEEKQQNLFKALTNRLKKYAIEPLSKRLPNENDLETRENIVRALANSDSPVAVNALVRTVSGTERERKARQALLSEYYLEPSKKRSEEAAALLDDAVENAKGTMRLLQTLNTATFGLGALLIIGGVIIAVSSEELGARFIGLFSGLGGIAAIVTIFLKDPLKRIQNAMGDLVQIQTAFTGFVWDLNLNATYIQSQYVAEGILTDYDIRQTTRRIADSIDKTMHLIQVYAEGEYDEGPPNLSYVLPPAGPLTGTITIFGHNLRPKETGSTKAKCQLAINRIPTDAAIETWTDNFIMIKLSEELVAKVGPTENGSTPRIWFSLLIDGLETNALPYSLSKKVEPAPVA